MTMRENVCVGAHALGRGGFLANALAMPLARREELTIAERADALIEEFGLERASPTVRRGRFRSACASGSSSPARSPWVRSSCSWTNRQAGLNHEEVDGLADEIRAIRDRRGVAVLLVEHHMNLVMRVSDQVVALDFGRVIANGAPDEVRANPRGGARLSRERRLSAPILEVKGLEAWYGPVQALFGVDFAVEDGGVTALLGANGAGKTTTLSALSGLIRR